MKNHLISTILLTATYVLSKGSGDLTQSPLTNFMSLGESREIGKGLGSEGDFFRLILQVNTDEKQCEHKLEEYCKLVQEDNQGLGGLPRQIKNLCKDANKTSCSTYLNETKEKCIELEEKLQDPLTPSYTNCSYLLQECLLLQGFCGEENKKKCNELLDKCHNTLLQNIYDYIFLKFFAEWLYSHEFKRRFQKECHQLKGQGEGFIRGCLNWTETQQRLKRYHDQKCNELEVQIEKVLNNDDYSEKNNCKKLSEECFYYGNQCNKREEKRHKKLKCFELQKKCSNKGYGFEPPYTEEELPKLTLYQRVNIKAIFHKALKYSGLIMGPPHKNMDGYELLFWVLNHWDPNPGLHKCKELQTGKSCYLIKYYSNEFSHFCNYGSFYRYGPNVCNNIYNRIYSLFTGQRTIIQEGLQRRKVPSGLVAWLNLDFSLFNHENCRVSSAHCTFLTESQSKNPKIKKLFESYCSNLQRLCYKEGRRDGVDLILVELLIQSLFQEHKRFTQLLCLRWLFNYCDNYQTNFPQIENMAACTYPQKTCRRLEIIIDRRCVELQNNLARNPLSNKTFCSKLSNECNLLSDICHPTNVKNCNNLKKRCLVYGASDSKQFKSFKI